MPRRRQNAVALSPLAAESATSVVNSAPVHEWGGGCEALASGRDATAAVPGVTTSTSNPDNASDQHRGEMTRPPPNPHGSVWRRGRRACPSSAARTRERSQNAD